MANTSLHAAKKDKNDEFYTQLPDIEKELFHYWEHFKGKTILCNCDDPYESNFFKYFALHFNHLGLRKLIATCYDGSPITGNELLIQFDWEDQEEAISNRFNDEQVISNRFNDDGQAIENRFSLKKSLIRLKSPRLKTSTVTEQRI